MPTVNLATLKVSLKADNADYKSGVSGAKKETKSFGDHANKFIAGAAAGAFAAAGVAAAKFAKDSLQEFKVFEKGMNEVFTLMPGMSKKAMGEMRQDVLDLGTDIGRVSDEVIPALYQSLSAGVPEDNVIDFLRTANEAARGGVTDLETAVDGITSVVNAYGAEVVDATEASDLMFTAVKGGKTNFEQLSKSLYNVIPTAAGLNVEFGNVTAALATLTAQGTPTTVATTQIRQLLVELSKEGGKAAITFEKLAGKSFADFIAEGGNVQQALQIMEQGAADSDVRLSDLFSSVEAGNAALGLTGTATDKFTQELNAAERSAGATAEAANLMGESLDVLEGRAAATTEELKLLVGEGLSPTKRWFLETKIAALEGLGATIKSDRAYKDLRQTLDATGAGFWETQKTVQIVSDALDEFGGHTVENEGYLIQQEIAVRKVKEGFRGTAEELVSLVEAEMQASRETDQLINKYSTLYAEEIKAAEATRELTDTQGASVVATNAVVNSVGYLSMAYDGMTAMQEANAVAAEAQAAALEHTNQAAEQMKSVLDGLHSRSGDFFTDALNSEDALMRWSSGLSVVGGRTAEQNAVLGELRGEYNKINENILSYESGIKSIGLTEEERNEKLAEQRTRLDEVSAAMSPLLAIEGEIIDSGGKIVFNQAAINDELYKAADAAGASSVELALLSIATGDLSEAEAEAALKSAALSEKVSQLGTDIANGLDPAEALANLDTFQKELSEADFTFDLSPSIPETAEEEVAAKATELLDLLPAEQREFELEASTTQAVTTVEDFFNTTVTPMIEDEYEAIIDANTEYAVEHALEAQELFREITGTYTATITAKIVPPSGYGGDSGGDSPGDGGYAVGGFTGFGSDTDVAGVVHRNEYVLSASAVDNLGGPAAVDAMHNSARGGADGGGGGVTIHNHNNTREAVALSMAETYQMRRANLDAWMGVD